ncbi:alcohol dehydrogenase catalytic domain-containing protein [Microlunatus sp. GCM10028923]|uniref:alcohol dehydrogenase catalytic domain-containing protein n=1 Tax=Microlunatus sp. GCM10028923 TaxID=3273400 RepID=UPI0036078E33
MQQFTGTTRAAYVNQPGPPESIMVGSLPVPPLGDDQVLIRVEVVAVNHVDTFIRSGAYRTPLPYPFVIGRDLAGTVIATGPSVAWPAPGARVWCNSLGHGGRQGSFAEFVVADAERVYPLPAGVPGERAVAVAHAAATAHLGLHREARVRPGETVLVDGAAGAVGSAAVRLAAAAGARTIAVSSAGGLAAAERSGADRILARDDLDRLDEGVDVWWDASGRLDAARVLPAMNLGGRLVVIAGLDHIASFPLGALYTRDLSLHGFAISNASAAELRAAADMINSLLAAGGLDTEVYATLPLDRAAEAHRLVEQGVPGKILVRIDAQSHHAP